MVSSSSSEEEEMNLHGDLHLRIIEVRSLPNLNPMMCHLRGFCYTSCNKSVVHNKADVYVTLSVGGAVVARTCVVSGRHDNPVWDARFSLPLAHPATFLLFQVKDNNMFGADLIGAVTFPVTKIITGELIHDWFPIVGSNGASPKTNSAIRLEMQFRQFNGNPANFLDIKIEPDRFDVRRSYFPIKQGCQVTLYQDAHVPDGALPQVQLDDGMVFKQGQCWEDICHAILEAHHLVYIIGWSIYHKVRLVREPSKPLPSGGDLMLGELLKYKSQEGVRVLLLVWDDKTSHDNLFINTKGLMQTHDEETRKFFKHSSVICVLSPRYASNKLSIFKQQVVGTLYTHHQKCVIVDTQAYGNKRKITAFIGGLDLCDGRYDTPDHRLFRDLDSVFEGDFHNPTFPSETKGPRQPWHDWHCKIEGPAAYDVLKNFEQRWRKARKWSEFGRKIKRRAHWHDDSLIKVERISWILGPCSSISKNDPALSVSKEDDPENWHVQVFRSIDSGSLKGFPKDVHQAESQNLVYAKSLVIDWSIQTAYIHAIRAAQHFIYIENQYFLGSSYAWRKYKDAGADNLIPMELALKIASKIRAKERFAVYVIIPMWPEGIPSSASVQEILFWQGQTMQMMYEIVAEALHSVNMDSSHPKDYLNFYCLGNREEFPKENSDSSSHASNVNMVSASQKFGRFMIYVHSKGMIVDDEYVILGSANINQRSMAGSRDTEIAMGAYQPHHTWTKKKRLPHGQVYGYRMSLWAEHLGKLDDCFEDPKSLPCVESVNRIADENWGKYNSEEFICLQGHILKYPIDVDRNGKVGPLPGQESFPDVGGKVLGSRTTLPDALTT